MKVAFVGNNLGTIRKPWLLDGKGLMGHSGNNLGNLAFWYAADLLIDAEKYCIPWSAKRSDLPSDIKALVIPAANFINGTAKLQDLAKTVREFDLPCILIGIGAQAERENLPPQVDQSVIDFLKEVSARTPFIGLRGDFTKQMTDGFGIENTRVLGCPSILINPDPGLGRKLADKIKAGLSDGPYAVHAACVKEPLRWVEREFVRMINSHPGSKFVIQRPVELISFVRGEALNQQETEYFEKCVKFFGFANRAARFEDFLKEHTLVPTSIDSWIHSLMQARAGINTRIHGTLMGIAAGTPSLCVVHDSRTRELAKRLMVPALEIPDFVATRHQVDDMFSRAAFDGDKFDANRQSIARQYCELFDTVGLKASKHLISLAAQAGAIEPARVAVPPEVRSVMPQPARGADLATTASGHHSVSPGYSGGQQPERVSRVIAERATDGERWSKIESHNPGWINRARFAANFVPGGSVVLELGAGRAFLRDILPSTCRYIPSDIVAHQDDFLIVDLNAEKIDIPQVDVIVALGVFEYVYDIERLINLLNSRSRRIVFSYCCRVDGFPAHDQRLRQGWLSDLSRYEMEAKIKAAGAKIIENRVIQDNPAFQQELFVCEADISRLQE